MSSVIVPVSNQESETRYAAVKKQLPRGIVGKLFLKKVQDMIPRMKAFAAKRQPVSAEVYCADATEQLPTMRDAVDLVVTSPPYPNTYDYYLYHKFRMLWLDMDYREAQTREFGSRNKHTDERRGIEHYTGKMKQSLRLLHGVMKEDAYLCVVVGDAIVRGEYFKMDDIIVRLGEQCDFSYARSFSYSLRRYTRAFTPGVKSTQKAGHIIVLRRT
jgi:site-specific DNA-methyltransferase (cytosine-N4-specific)